MSENSKFHQNIQNQKTNFYQIFKALPESFVVILEGVIEEFYQKMLCHQKIQQFYQKNIPEKNLKNY